MEEEVNKKCASKLCEPVNTGCLKNKANGGYYLIANLNNNTVLSICSIYHLNLIKR